MSSETQIPLNSNEYGLDFCSLGKEEIKALAYYIAKKYEKE